MSTENGDISRDLLELFPEAKLTMKEKLPTALIYTAAIFRIGKAIDNIKYSEEELRVSVLGLVAMIPDELRDEEFLNEMEAAMKNVILDVRPIFCEQRASVEYCKRRGIPILMEIKTFDYLAVYHCCFNLLLRKNMLLKTENKEIFTGKKAKPGEPEYEAEGEEPEE